MQKPIIYTESNFKISEEAFYNWANSQAMNFFNSQHNNISSLLLQNNTYRAINNSLLDKKNLTLQIGKYSLIFNYKKRSVILLNTKTLKATKAQCYKEDKFSPNIAIAICWARMKNEVVPKIKETKFLYEMKYGEKFKDSNGLCTFIAPIPEKKNAYAVMLEYKTSSVLVLKQDSSVPYEMIE